ncbi:9659_t:CDS:10 [Paraglomus occultum]|uniref:9659_t:CDS:1 n=1 Tax=Paraglomus occultum TaxID=144539 RepID=A0A9N9AR94_9GLOM|nr:9659_t:CDS:10 [Paraglomus occultum]
MKQNLALNIPTAATKLLNHQHQLQYQSIIKNKSERFEERRSTATIQEQNQRDYVPSLRPSPNEYQPQQFPTPTSQSPSSNSPQSNTQTLTQEQTSFPSSDPNLQYSLPPPHSSKSNDGCLTTTGHEFLSPNLYKLTLQLTTELAISKWWDNVVDIFTSSYRASHLTLSVPHDLTDTVNTPWGIKAMDNRDQYLSSGSCLSSSIDNNHIVFDKLQSFDCDTEQLIDNKKILYIVQGGRIVVVSREYRKTGDERPERRLWPSSTPDTPLTVGEATSYFTQKKESSSSAPNNIPNTPLLNDLEEGNLGNRLRYRDSMPYYMASANCEYYEYEQQQPSPWSQSPTPSPAMTDSNVNPFFQTIPEIDDSAFNPNSEFSSSYSSVKFDYSVNSSHACSIIHIPLIHPTTARNVLPSTTRQNPIPIAILSFMSSVVPYPPNIVASLQSVAPFLATTMSMASIHQQSINQLMYFDHARSMSTKRRRYRRNGKRLGRIEDKITVNGDDNYVFSDVSTDDGEVSWESDIESVASSFKPEHAASFPTSSYYLINPDKKFYVNGCHSDESWQGVKKQGVVKNGQIAQSPQAYQTQVRPHVLTESEDEFHPAHEEPLTPETPVASRPINVSTSMDHARTDEKRKPRRSSKGSFAGSRRSSKDEMQRVVVPTADMYRMILDDMPNVAFTFSRTNGDCTWVNARFTQYTSLPVQDLLGNNWLRCIHKDDQQRVWDSWRAAFNRGESYSDQYRIRRFDGHYRWFLGRARPIRDARGVIIHWLGTSTDVHDQKVAEEQQLTRRHIEANEKKYRMLAEAIPQIVFTATPKDGILYVNNKWTDYSGMNYEQTKGLGFLSMVHPEDRDKCVLPQDNNQEGGHGEIYTREVRLQAKDESYRWFLVKCISVESSEQGRKWFGTCTDINEHKIMEQQLTAAHDAAQRLTESKTRFLSNMSHGKYKIYEERLIRTPLIGITGTISFMLATNMTDEQLDYAYTIQQSADALLMVINDILDLSKVEAGMMKLAYEPFSIHTMLEDTNELLSNLAIQKGLELSFIIEDDVPDVVCGDRTRLRQVLLNLVGNAIKFTTAGEIFSRCSVKSIDPDENTIMLLFAVVDTGEGFDQQEEALIFKPYSQADSSSTRKHGGSGLGLVISRQLIELHGGSMSCVSKKGVGSTFYFSARFSIPSKETVPNPPTPTGEVSNSPFFRYSKAEVALANKRSGGGNDGVCEPDQMASTISSSSAKSSDPSDVSNNATTLKALPPRLIVPTQSSEPPRNICVFVVADLLYSRETIEYYVRSVLKKNASSEIDVFTTFAEANRILASPNIKRYTHILISLSSQAQIITLASIVKNSPNISSADCIIFTSPFQRIGILEGADKGELPNRVDFIYKPVNKSKMACLFNSSAALRNNSMKRRNTNRIVTSHKELFKSMIDDVGGKGYKILLAEDDPVNQRVMIKYLKKVGLDVTVAANGIQCLSEFFSHSHDYFSLILCDLFMPLKDGYGTTEEIRKWESENLKPGSELPIPIIALSANVMTDVAERCLEAGFTAYVSKPVNFAALSDVIRRVLRDSDQAKSRIS